MRTLLLLLCLCCAGCSHTAQDRWTGRDKAQHFIVSAALSAAGNEYGQQQGWRAPQQQFRFDVCLQPRRGERAV